MARRVSSPNATDAGIADGMSHVDDLYSSVLALLGNSVASQPAYRRCASSAERDCRLTVAQALFHALDTQIYPLLHERAPDGFRLDHASAAALDAIVQGSTDEVERIAALAVLTQSSHRSDAFASAVYDSLPTKSIPEVVLTLRRHPRAELPARAVESIAAIASAPDGDTRTRAAALRALGSESNSAVLERVAVDMAFADEPLHGRLTTALGRSLGLCGYGCESLITSLASSDSARARQIGWLAVARNADRRIRDAVEANALGPPMSPEEARLRQRFGNHQEREDR